MQSSKSIGLPTGTFTDPEYSMQIGVKYFLASRTSPTNFEMSVLGSGNTSSLIALKSFHR